MCGHVVTSLIRAVFSTHPRMVATPLVMLQVIVNCFIASPCRESNSGKTTAPRMGTITLALWFASFDIVKTAPAVVLELLRVIE